jgi:hypothetical protein
MRRVAIALVHHPVLDKEGATVTSAITNLDVHDLSRSARTYGCSDYFVVHPIEAQRALVHRITDHWTHGSSSLRIPARKDALALVRPVAALSDAFDALGGRAAIDVWSTAARSASDVLTFEAARKVTTDRPLLILFGTAWGLTDDVLSQCDARLEPIRAGTDAGYNHLSVRSACAITLDRLFGPVR